MEFKFIEFCVKCIYIFIVVMFACISFANTTDDFEDWIFDFTSTPNEIYESSKMNWFGVIVVFILRIILEPIQYACRFLWWLFHVGRKMRE